MIRRCFQNAWLGSGEEGRAVAAEGEGVERKHDDVAEPEQEISRPGEQTGAEGAVEKGHGAALAGKFHGQPGVGISGDQRHRPGDRQKPAAPRPGPAAPPGRGPRRSRRRPSRRCRWWSPPEIRALAFFPCRPWAPSGGRCLAPFKHTIRSPTLAARAGGCSSSMKKTAPPADRAAPRSGPEKWLSVSGPGRALEQGFELGHRQGPGIEETLGVAAAPFLEKILLRLGLHSLGNDPEIHAPGQGNNRGGNRGVVGIVGDIADKHPVDLELIDRQAPQAAERGIAGAEIVDGQGNPHLVQFAHGLDGSFDIVT